MNAGELGFRMNDRFKIGKIVNVQNRLLFSSVQSRICIAQTGGCLRHGIKAAVVF